MYSTTALQFHKLLRGQLHKEVAVYNAWAYNTPCILEALHFLIIFSFSTSSPLIPLPYHTPSPLLIISSSVGVCVANNNGFWIG
jgi:hypothetical protein